MAKTPFKIYNPKNPFANKPALIDKKKNTITMQMDLASKMRAKKDAGLYRKKSPTESNWIAKTNRQKVKPKGK